MDLSTVDFARSVTASFHELGGFEATQSVRASSIEATARVRFHKPDRLHLEYRSYRNPITELDEVLSNGAEFTGDELVGMVLSHDGRNTWLYDAAAGIAIHKPTRALFEPLPGVNAMGEIGFLEHLTRDFLVRDAGTEAVSGRPARLLGLKPRHTYRSHLLKTVAFPIRRATLALDEETRFPLRIHFLPDRSSPLFPFVGPHDAVTVEYTDVRLETSRAADAFSPPEGTRVFREALLYPDALIARVPFPMSIDGLLQRKYHSLGEGGSAVVDEKNERGYCTLLLVPEADDEGRPRLLTLRAGNYLSRNMSRRKATISEKGHEVHISPLTAKLLNRGQLWAEHVPGAEPRALLEIAWQENDVFWFLAGEGIDEPELIELASALVGSASGQ